MTPTTGVILVIEDKVIDTFSRFAQYHPTDTEAGGILLGRRRGAHFEILDATVPTKFDTRTRTFFKRSEKIHSDIAKRMWSQSKGQISYIGEWHSHPEVVPSPSSVDIFEWSKLSVECKSPHGYSMVIVGTQGIWCGMTKISGEVVQAVQVN